MRRRPGLPWSPDGRRLVYSAEAPGGNAQLVAVLPVGTGRRVLTSDDPFCGCPDWAVRVGSGG